MGITEIAFKRASEEVKSMTSGANDQGIKRHIGKISEDEYNKLRSARQKSDDDRLKLRTRFRVRFYFGDKVTFVTV